jgi:hypothetical protein
VTLLARDRELRQGPEALMRSTSIGKDLERRRWRHLIGIDEALVLEIEELPYIVLWVSRLDVPEGSLLKVLERRDAARPHNIG